jgi:hypothetical protein
MKNPNLMGGEFTAHLGLDRIEWLRANPDGVTFKQPFTRPSGSLGKSGNSYNAHRLSLLRMIEEIQDVAVAHADAAM